MASGPVCKHYPHFEIIPFVEVGSQPLPLTQVRWAALAQQRNLMSDTPDVFVIGTIKMLAQLGQTEKIVELCNEWLDKFESRPTQPASNAGESEKENIAFYICY